MTRFAETQPFADVAFKPLEKEIFIHRFLEIVPNFDEHADSFYARAEHLYELNESRFRLGKAEAFSIFYQQSREFRSRFPVQDASDETKRWPHFHRNDCDSGFLSRRFCSRCVRSFKGRGKATYLRDCWRVSWSCFCPYDGFPLLQWPGDELNGPDFSTNNLGSSTERMVLAAWRGDPLNVSDEAEFDYLRWAPLWPSLSWMEHKWFSGKRLEMKAVLTDLARVLCSNFGYFRDRPHIDYLCGYDTKRLPFVERKVFPGEEPDELGRCRSASQLLAAMTVAFYVLQLSTEANLIWNPPSSVLGTRRFAELFCFTLTTSAFRWLEHRSILAPSSAWSSMLAFLRENGSPDWR